MDSLLLFAMIATAIAAAGGPKFTEADCCEAEFAFLEGEKKKRSGIPCGGAGIPCGGAGISCSGAGISCSGAGAGALVTRVVDLKQIYSLSLEQYHALTSECDNIAGHIDILNEYGEFDYVHSLLRKYDRTGARICAEGVVPKPFFTGPFYKNNWDTVPVSVPIQGNSYYLDDGSLVFLQVIAPYNKDLPVFRDTNEAAEEIVLAFLRFWDNIQDLKFDEKCFDLRCITDISLSDFQLATLSKDGIAAVKAGKFYLSSVSSDDYDKLGIPTFIDQYRRFTRAFLRSLPETETPNSELYLEVLLTELIRLHKEIRS